MDASLEHLRQLTATLRSNVEKCAANPDIDPVHDLRTGTRRVQAMVESMLRERGDDSLNEPAGRWLNMLKKLRRAAAAARDLDVHRKLLHKLVKISDQNKNIEATSGNNGAGNVAQPSTDVVESTATTQPRTPIERQADDLDAWLRHARQHHAASLKKKTAKWLSRFDEEAAAFESAIAQATRTRRRPRSAAIVALDAFACLAHEMHQLDTGNLHDFRKGAKKARYIAESVAEDPHAQAVGKTLKKLQDDIGDWHDWLVLAEEARTALDDDGRDLITLLDAERDRHYALAMKTVDRLRGKLMGEWVAASNVRRRNNEVIRN
ncbi:MAG TPA: CHAD domain-containing protein [Pseudacidobacterium sp.]|jgi:CHAD domain-containing protein|nr:CHAD domain-containing protein [Pseudacidobacterium sp.]